MYRWCFFLKILPYFQVMRLSLYYILIVEQEASTDSTFLVGACMYTFLFQLVDDPIFIPILQLEMDKNGHPAEFAQVVKEMQLGKTGKIRIENARKGRGKVRT